MAFLETPPSCSTIIDNTVAGTTVHKRDGSDRSLHELPPAAATAAVVLVHFIARELGAGRLAAFEGHVPGDSAGHVEVATLDSALRMPPL